MSVVRFCDGISSLQIRLGCRPPPHAPAFYIETSFRPLRQTNHTGNRPISRPSV